MHLLKMDLHVDILFILRDHTPQNLLSHWEITLSNPPVSIYLFAPVTF